MAGNLNIQGRAVQMMWNAFSVSCRNFTTKQVRFGFRKACVEFKKKRLDPDLPFYYHTSSHSRFYEGPLPDFNVSNTKKKRKFQTAPRREQPTDFASRRATIPVRGSL